MKYPSFLAVVAAFVQTAEAAPKFFSCLGPIYSNEYRIQLDAEAGTFILRQRGGTNLDTGAGDALTGGYRAVRTQNSPVSGWTLYEGVDALFSQAVKKRPWQHSARRGR